MKWAAFMADRSGPFKSLIAHMLNKASTAVPAAAVGAPVAGIATSQYAGQMQPPPQQGQ